DDRSEPGRAAGGDRAPDGRPRRRAGRRGAPRRLRRPAEADRADRLPSSGRPDRGQQRARSRPARRRGHRPARRPV
ncbi:MAG: hypothetical protein AVDCRST_MAG49-1155, partial [uncultured Thermomicrobiales bacterium]